MSRGLLLILTATIRPLTSVMLLLHDPEARRRQYLDALRGWLEQPGELPGDILFIENSGEDLAPFRQLVEQHNPHGRRVELVSLSLSYPQELGKGYGEFLAIDEGLARSQLATQHDLFAKCTGRLRVRNFDQLARRLPPDTDFAADRWAVVRQGAIDSRLLFWSRRFYDGHLRGLYRTMNDAAGVYAEHALHQAIKDHDAADAAGKPPAKPIIKTRRIITTLPLEPRWVGSSASLGIVYDGWSQKLRHPLRVVRRAWRRLWSQ